MGLSVAFMTHAISGDERVMAQDKRPASGRMKGQSQPGVAICVALDQPADRAQLVQRTGQSERPHFADRLIEFINPASTHFAAENIAKRRPGQAESDPSLWLDFDNRNRCQMRADSARVEVFTTRQTQAFATRPPMLQELGLRRREAGKIC